MGGPHRTTLGIKHIMEPTQNEHDGEEIDSRSCRNHIIALKETILRFKVDEANGFEILVDFIESLTKLLKSTQSVNEDAVLIVDTALIWFSRAMQFSKRNKLENYNFGALEETVKSLFNYIDHLHQSSHGAFSNALSNLLKKLLQFVEATQLSDTLVSAMVLKAGKRPNTHKSFYVIMEAILRFVTRSASIIKQIGPSFEKKCFDAMRFSSLVNSASKCISVYYKRLADPVQNEAAYFVLWTSEVEAVLGERNAAKDKVIAHLIPMLFRDIPEKLIQWLKSLTIKKEDPYWPHVMLPLLLIGLEISKSNDPSKVVLESEIEAYLFNHDSFVRLSAFKLICSSVDGTSVPSKFVTNFLTNETIMLYLISELLTPDDRTTFVFHLRSALLKIKGFAGSRSQKPNLESDRDICEIKKACSSVFGILQLMLIPDSSYAQLCISTDVISFLITDEFDGIARSKKPSKDRLPLVKIFSDNLVRTLLRFTTNNYDDIRRKCSVMLSYCPYAILERILQEQPLQNSLKYVNESKHGTTDSFALLFMTIARAHAKNSPISYLQLLQEVITHLETSVARGDPISGALATVAGVLNAASPNILEANDSEFKTLTRRLMELVNGQWSLIIAAQEEGRELSVNENGEYWKVLKESSLLLEALLNINRTSRERYITDFELEKVCDNLMDALAFVSHRGAFASILLAFMKYCTIFLSGELLEKPMQWLQFNLTLVRTKKQLISRRSAGLPYLISGILVATAPQKNRIKDFMEVAFIDLLLIVTEKVANGQQSMVDLPQVNAFNCMTQIFKESSLKEHYKKYLCQALDASLKNINHPVWAIKNSALMLFTSLQSNLFGSNKLEDVFPSVKVEFFFAQYPEIQNILLTHLKNLNLESPNEAIPILSILGRLQDSIGQDSVLEPFRNLVRTKYLQHNLWKIREMAAVLLVNMTAPSCIIELIHELIPNNSTPRNAAHGRLLCILELVKQVSREDLTRAGIVESIATSFEEERKMKSFSKWFILRVYVMIYSLIPFIEVSSLKELLFECINSDIDVNGSVKLFIGTCAKTLLKASETLEDAEHLSINLFKSGQVEACEETVRFWLLNANEFRKRSELQLSFLEIMEKSKLPRQVFKLFLQLAAGAEIPISFALNDERWPDEWKCYSMAIKATGRNADILAFSKVFEQYSRDDQPEMVRLQAVHAAQTLAVHQRGSLRDYAHFFYCYHQKLSDECLGIRRLAQNQFDVKNLDWTKEYLEKFGEAGQKTVLEAILASIERNINDAKEELDNTSFHIERDNLFRNEVHDLTSDASAICQQVNWGNGAHNHVKEKLLDCILECSNLVLKNKNLIQSWTYNTHIDTAIRKVVTLVKIFKDEELERFSESMLEFLQVSNYPDLF